MTEPMTERSTHMSQTRNWFDAGGSNYANFRPTYPQQLVDELARVTPHHRVAVDVGCGTGQLTGLLAGSFEEVIGIDPSADQIKNARPHDRVRYAVAPAEQLPVEDASVDLITVAQAAHWFDLPKFYDEVRRIAAPGAVIALVSYGVNELDPDLTDRFLKFYTDEIGPYWPPERAIVDEGYRTILFPFEELEVPPIHIESKLTLEGLLGYFSTWSAVRAATEAGRGDILQSFAVDLAELWGDPEAARTVRWPLGMRVGVVSSAHR